MSHQILDMDLYSGLLMVDIKLWSKISKTFRSMLITFDTGASITTISKDILYQLGYEFTPKDKKRITTASGIEYVDSAVLEKIRMGNIELKNVEVYAHTFPQESFSTGVLGLNVLQNFDIQLLFSKQQIMLSPFPKGASEY